ncbi:MAG TPA: holo-[acyl-carrier-protein] synthase [Planctomycetaceae bacterium]|nr:holo-[acyl-carrier-protein] synthase [Planctomycetaceae bacterium]
MNFLGIGTDIIECERIRRILAKHPEHFVSHVFTEEEIRYCAGFRDPTERFAGRWAAKEAVFKALGTGWIGGITWQDVETLNDVSGKPRVRLSGGARKVAEACDIREIQISISHCKSHAIAFVVALGP